ncbi:MAG: OadG family transporter subunit [Dethiobacteria bacterium]|jgi:sodium pump decarboxylase gamma subunit
MADKFAFTMQLFLLGFSVVMIVLFLLYLLIALTNRLWSRLIKKDELLASPAAVPAEGLSGPSPQLVAAITAAVNRYRAATSEQGPVRIRVTPAKAGSSPGSLWTAAGRIAQLENSNFWESLRRK